MICVCRGSVLEGEEWEGDVGEVNMGVRRGWWVQRGVNKGEPMFTAGPRATGNRRP